MEEMLIVIDNALVYAKKDGSGNGTRIGYRFIGDGVLANNGSKFKGYASLSHFTASEDLFNKLPLEIFGQPVVAVVVTEPSRYNPLESRKVLKSVEFEGNVIDLV